MESYKDYMAKVRGLGRLSPKRVEELRREYSEMTTEQLEAEKSLIGNSLLVSAISNLTIAVTPGRVTKGIRRGRTTSGDFEFDGRYTFPRDILDESRKHSLELIDEALEQRQTKAS